MHKRKLYIFLLLLMSALVFFGATGGGCNPPIEDTLEKAKVLRAQAEEYNADKYAPEELKKAEEKYRNAVEIMGMDTIDETESTNTVSTNTNATDESINDSQKTNVDNIPPPPPCPVLIEKLENGDSFYIIEKLDNGASQKKRVTFKQKKQAYQDALSALSEYSNAINKAKPMLIKEAISNIQEAMTEAREKQAHIISFSTNEYNSAKRVIDDIKALEQEKKYLEGYKLMDKGVMHAERALNIAESKQNILSEKISKVIKAKEELDNFGPFTMDPDRYSKAEKGIEKLKDLQKDYKIREGIDNADMLLKEFKDMLLLLKKERAASVMAEAQKMITKLDEAGIPSVKPKEYKECKELMERANSEYKGIDYDQAYFYANKVIKLAEAILQSLTKENLTMTRLQYSEYKVRLIPERRDCLWRIAEYGFIYGNPYLWPLIYKANKKDIRDPDLIFPGQIFVIPPVEGKVYKKLLGIDKKIHTDENLRKKEVIK